MNTLGNKLRVPVFGQSHAPAIGCVVEGLPAGFAPDLERLGAFMARRAPGRNAWSTNRREDDVPEILSGLVEGRTINLMDTKGIIVASSDPARVGSFHQGAMEAVRTGKMVNITKEQVPDFSGAREGCNMPLRVNGAIIGVVGIRGDPPEIQALAHLLEVYAAKYFQLEAMASPRLAEGELRRMPGHRAGEFTMYYWWYITLSNMSKAVLWEPLMHSFVCGCAWAFRCW